MNLSAHIARYKMGFCSWFLFFCYRYGPVRLERIGSYSPIRKLLNFRAGLSAWWSRGVALVTKAPPQDIQNLVEDIRIPGQRRAHGIADAEMAPSE